MTSPNPYSFGSREARAWYIGRADGRTKRLRIIRNDRHVYNAITHQTELELKARQEGRLAGQGGLKSKDNPYPVPSHDALVWELARKKHFRAVSER